MIDDPYLEVDDIVLMIRLVEKLLTSKGNPLSVVFDVRIGKNFVDNLTIYELAYLVWQQPYESDLLEDWDFEDNDIQESDDEDQDINEPVNNHSNVESINQRFRDALEDCFKVI